jgi:hypothetical protein
MSEKQQISRNMTAVRILENAETDYAEVVFLESAQFYRLPKENPAFDSMTTALRDAMAKGLAVEVRLASLTSNIIEEIKASNTCLD